MRRRTIGGATAALAITLGMALPAIPAAAAPLPADGGASSAVPLTTSIVDETPAPADADDELVFDGIPVPLAQHYPSLSPETLGISAGGNVVQLAEGARTVTEVSTVLLSWACGRGIWSMPTGHANACVSEPGGTFELDVTLEAFAVDENLVPTGDALLSRTENFKIPTRPARDDVRCTDGKWYDAETDACLYGVIYTLTWDDLDVELPGTVALVASFDPAARPNQSIFQNFPLIKVDPSVGTNPEPGTSLIDATHEYFGGPGLKPQDGYAAYGEFAFDVRAEPLPQLLGCESTDLVSVTSLADWSQDGMNVGDVTSTLTEQGLRLDLAGKPQGGATPRVAGYYTIEPTTLAAFGDTAIDAGTPSPGVHLRVDLDGDGNPDGNLTYEPVYQGNFWMRSAWNDVDLSEIPEAGGLRFAPLLTWLRAFPKAEVHKVGYLLTNGSADPLSVTIASITAGCTQYVFEAVPEPPACTVDQFIDVPVGMQFYDEILWMACEGISTGWTTPNGPEFRPLAPVQRDAMAAFLYRLAGQPAWTPPAASPFTDVTPTTQFYAEITWAYANGITTGWPDGTFRPVAPIARDAMAAFLYRFADGVLDTDVASFETPTTSPFLDVAVGTMYFREIAWAHHNEVTTGWPDGTFRPLESIKRDATAAFLHRVAHELG